MCNILYNAKRSLLIALPLALMLGVRAAAAQQVPTPEEAKRALQQPGAGDALRTRIQQSGLSSDQIRERLRANGYAADMLDAFLGQAQPGVAAPEPGQEELDAIQTLGLPVQSGVVAATPEAVRRSDIFGVDVFRRSTTQFFPLLSGPVPPDYRVGPGDALTVILTGDVEAAYNLQVSRDGSVVLPQVGQLQVANLTMDQVRNLLGTRLGRVYSGIRHDGTGTTQYDVTVARVRAVQVYVVGEAAQPGAYQVSALGTVLTALYAAGGPTDLSNTRQVTVQRAGKLVATFDLYDYLVRGDARNDIRLENGDVVFVPVRSRRAEVSGAVNRPMKYDVGPKETLVDLIQTAGGLSADAATMRITINRVVPPAQRTPGGPQRVVLDVPLLHGTQAANGPIPPVPVEDGDLVVVSKLDGSTKAYVEVTGSVYLPGRFGFEQGLKLSRLIALAGGLRPATYAGRVLIERLNQVDSTRTLVRVALPPDSAALWIIDPTLQEYDIITIFGRPDMREAITTTITGAVNRGGVFPWREGMTLRDLVLMAHGTRSGASLQFAEIARLPIDRAAGQLATTVRVPLDSTYLFDRDSLGRYIGPPGANFPASGSPEVTIQPWDNVLIFLQPEFEYQRSVTITGQVKYPGQYALRNKGERLSSIIARAGGMTERAFPMGVRFQRQAGSVGRINIDLPRALHDTNSRYNLILQPSDNIDIPEYQPTVKVAGAVNSPGSVLWERGRSLDYYLSAAGGVTQLGLANRASVRQANGTVQSRGHGFLFFHGSAPTPGPGSEISVPAKPAETERGDALARLSAVTSLLASAVAILITVTKL